MGNSSGKLVIVGILTVAILSAVASWWFRYAATHRSAQFWGPAATQLIRDASRVELVRFEPPRLANEIQSTELLDSEANKVDVSNARGLTHLRNALIEDRSFRWPPTQSTGDELWQWALIFRQPRGDAITMLVSPDGAAVIRQSPPSNTVLSSEPIAAGLLAILRENDGSALPR